MAHEVTTPLLPCRDIDEVASFYRVLGFEQTHHQVRPNPYVVLRREDLELHFFAMPDFNPEVSYGQCLVAVPDTRVLYEAFAKGMRAGYGKLLVSGIPRMTRPRARKNTGDLAGFCIVDPGGNTIRIFPSGPSPDSADTETTGAETGVETAPEAEQSKLKKVLETAIVFGDSKGDIGQAIKILDSTLAREQEGAPCADLFEALAYRAELALRRDDFDRARTLLAQAHATPLTDPERRRLADVLSGVDELEELLTLASDR